MMADWSESITPHGVRVFSESRTHDGSGVYDIEIQCPPAEMLQDHSDAGKPVLLVGRSYEGGGADGYDALLEEYVLNPETRHPRLDGCLPFLPDLIRRFDKISGHQRMMLLGALARELG